jgi:4-hydroxy-tetrahydrodipicolinate reductase
MQALILGNGNMGQAIVSALVARGHGIAGAFGTPSRNPRPLAADLGPVDVAFEFSHAAGVVANVGYSLDAGCRRIVIGTTSWADDAETVATLLQDAAAAAVVAPSYSVGIVLFGRIAETAARLFGQHAEYDPYIFEWHRNTKRDRPSGTALKLAERVLPHLPSKRRARLAEGEGAPDPSDLEIVSLRAGASPGLHVLGFDAPGESVELRLTARDRSAYVAGAILAAERLLAEPALEPGIHSFESIVDGALAETFGSAADAATPQSPERSIR